MKSEGRLDEQDLPDLVQELSRERWNGTLRLQKEDHRIGITAESGQLVFATSSNPDYRLGPRPSRELAKRHQGQPEHVVAISWKAQQRLGRTWRRLAQERGKRRTLVAVAVARELAGFVWAIAKA